MRIIVDNGYAIVFAFVLETDNKTGFENRWTGPLLTEPGPVRGSHGFHPDKGPRPPILAMGPGFRRGAVLENANLTDGAPTWAKLLGASLPDAEGRPLDEILIQSKPKLNIIRSEQQAKAACCSPFFGVICQLWEIRRKAGIA